ncbi:General secretion pathway protein A [hydrothermal vent metagenome]|uniref:General secretion pathway protein A n=1 Tax=hydrothermal vent metagenome TaxID=652676 RepID=A0A3B1D4L7_9ZZZZ
MYEKFYALKENPFNITSDPEYFFSSTRHCEAFSNLTYGIENRKGILVVSGEIGTGKTTLCRMLLSKLDHRTKTAFILNPSFSNLQLLQLILKDLGIQSKACNKFDLINALNEFLLNETRLGNNVVLIIDEAQNLHVKQLEQIRLLSNLETVKEKLLQIILVGQPELNDKLKLTDLRQLNQRVTVRYHISPLERHELSGYIQHRIAIASFDSQNPKPQFTQKAIETIYEHSGGTPRMVNILCDRSLLAGYTDDVYTITEKILYRCIQEVVLQ